MVFPQPCIRDSLYRSVYRVPRNSGHLCLEIELIFPISKNNTSSKKRNFYRGDYKTANSKILEIDWNIG